MPRRKRKAQRKTARHGAGKRQQRHASGTPDTGQPGPAPQPARTTESGAGSKPAAHNPNGET